MTKKLTSNMNLDALAITITEELESAQKSFLKVGECLCNASDRLGEEGKKSSDLVTWAEKNCGIKKAQMYKLMKVYETFGDNTAFKGVSMRVLYTLTHQPADVVEEAKEKAAKGSLDTNTLNKIINDNAPEPKVINKSPGVPAVNGSKKEPAPVIKKINNDEQIKGMTETIKELNETVKALRAELSDAKKNKQPKDTATIPFLPQFKSKNMCVRLGLEGESCADKKEINKSYRALAKIFTATTNKKASEALKAARDKLLKEAV